MNKNLAYIYLLIMLECRLSLKDASQIFKVNQEELEKVITDKNIFDSFLIHAVKYLIYSEAYAQNLDNNAKGKFKAKILYNKLIKILKIKDKEERYKQLQVFINNLNGINVEEYKKNLVFKYSPEAKKEILKYKLKYALSNTYFEYFLEIDARNLRDWEEAVEDEYLRKRLFLLREYGRNVTPYTLKLKKHNRYRNLN